MNPICCGNNAYHPDLLSGDRALGTRYTCLQKGKDNGYSQPADPNFLLPYQPIDATKKYCGNKAALPVGYSRFGGLYECYLKGMGVGKKLKAQAGIPAGDSSSPPSPPYNSPNNSSEYDEKYGRNEISQSDLSLSCFASFPTGKDSFSEGKEGTITFEIILMSFIFINSKTFRKSLFLYILPS